MERIKSGDQFSELTTIQRIPKDQFNTTRWLCRCSCGKEVTVISGSLRNGNTRSCGCKAGFWRQKHGMTGTVIHHTWGAMLNRCRTPTCKEFPHYGGRGIYICERWLKFENFYADMGPKPLKMTLERKDNNGPYSPENCIWASRKDQQNNRRANIKITHNGLTLTLSQWAEKTGLNRSCLSWRYNQKWPIDKFFEPADPKRTNSRKWGIPSH